MQEKASGNFLHSQEPGFCYHILLSESPWLQATHPKSFSPEIIAQVPGSASASPEHSVVHAACWGCAGLLLSFVKLLLAQDNKSPLVQ